MGSTTWFQPLLLPLLLGVKWFMTAFVEVPVPWPLHPRRPRGSQSGAGEMARRKFSRTGGRTPGYQISPDHFQTASRILAPDWAEKIPCIILPNQEPVFAKPFGNGPVRLGTQGFFRPFLKTFVAPFRPPPTDCPWVSEDVATHVCW